MGSGDWTLPAEEGIGGAGIEGMKISCTMGFFQIAGMSVSVMVVTQP